MPDRDSTSQTGRIMPGFKPVLELLQNEPQRICRIYMDKALRRESQISSLCHKKGVPIEKVDALFLDSICRQNGDRRVSHQGLAAELSEARLADVDELLAMAPSSPLPLIIALDQVKDPGNLGAICRTAYALGCAGIITPKRNSASLGPAAYKSSAGALEKMPFAIAGNLAHALDRAEENDFVIYGTACGDPNRYGPGGHIQINAFECQWRFPAILALGGENNGLRPGIAKRCSCFVHIPLARNFDSLNVAQAGAIILGLCAAFLNKC